MLHFQFLQYTYLSILQVGNKATSLIGEQKTFIWLSQANRRILLIRFTSNPAIRYREKEVRILPQSSDDEGFQAVTHKNHKLELTLLTAWSALLTRFAKKTPQASRLYTVDCVSTTTTTTTTTTTAAAATPVTTTTITAATPATTTTATTTTTTTTTTTITAATPATTTTTTTTTATTTTATTITAATPAATTTTTTTTATATTTTTAAAAAAALLDKDWEYHTLCIGEMCGSGMLFGGSISIRYASGRCRGESWESRLKDRVSNERLHELSNTADIDSEERRWYHSQLHWQQILTDLVLYSRTRVKKAGTGCTMSYDLRTLGRNGSSTETKLLVRYDWTSGWHRLCCYWTSACLEVTFWLAMSGLMSGLTRIGRLFGLVRIGLLAGLVETGLLSRLIFGKLKSYLGGRRFATEGYVIEAEQQWCHQQPKYFYEQGIKKSVEQESDFVHYPEKKTPGHVFYYIVSNGNIYGNKYLPPSMLSQNRSLDLMGNREWEQKTGLFLLKVRQIRTPAVEVCDAN
ncbi:hypothetical protein ANN_23267 [Periplaneta americana]|uniref:Uncharacterized protein n=1 Tax=Periplaneta americana TaxID=6978 RepID=A0ABQ8SKL9_PERAM|nr:hypothetical protein ANN_23267 [Periplaneta americana]